MLPDIFKESVCWHIQLIISEHFILSSPNLKLLIYDGMYQNKAEGF